jgi:hypothetical protein
MRNVGKHRDKITLKYVATDSQDDLGGAVLTYTSYEVYAHMEQLDSSQSLRLGLDLMTEAYEVICRPPAVGRPAKVEFDGETYSIRSYKVDKDRQFMEMVISIQR